MAVGGGTPAAKLGELEHRRLQEGLEQRAQPAVAPTRSAVIFVTGAILMMREAVAACATRSSCAARDVVVGAGLLGNAAGRHGGGGMGGGGRLGGVHVCSRRWRVADLALWAVALFGSELILPKEASTCIDGRLLVERGDGGRGRSDDSRE